MNSKDYLSNLKVPIKQAIKDRQAERQTPTSSEVLIKHPENNSGLHLREDGCLELFNSSGYILIDSSGSIYINGNQLSISGSNINFDLSDSNSFNIQSDTLNKKTLDKNDLLSIKDKDTYIYYSKDVRQITDIEELEKCSIVELFNQIQMFNKPDLWDIFNGK